MATILIVDDSLVSRRLLGHTLRQRGHAICTADHGGAALELLALRPVDLMIADIAMPGIDGVELLRRVRGDARHAGLPVIMLTASGEEGDRAAAERAGATNFLTKPTSSRELLATVERLLGGE